VVKGQSAPILERMIHTTTCASRYFST
jgi:hypothetical protein